MRPLGDAVFSPAGYLIRIVLLLLALLQLYIVILAFAHRRRALYRGTAAAHFAALFILFLLLTDGTYTPPHLPAREVFPAAVTAVYRVPVVFCALLEAVSCGTAALYIRSHVRFVKDRPSFDSVKEAMDDLPVGVCFIAENGTVPLCNLQMNAWCKRLTEQPLTNGKAYLQKVKAAGEDKNGRTLLRLGEDCVLLFAEDNVKVNGKSFLQLTAADVTQQFRITAELEKNNAKLRDISLRMKAYSLELTELVMNRERLSARIAVHDGVGHALLRAKHYLNDPNGNDAADLYVLLRQTNEMLRTAGEFPEEYTQDPLEQAVRLSRGIGVSVSLEGTAPENGKLREILGQAVRECAMNTVKHADGDELAVLFAESSGRFTVTLCSNGTAAEKPVVLTGGLRSLQETVRSADGTMRVQTAPRFTVTLELPK